MNSRIRQSDANISIMIQASQRSLTPSIWSHVRASMEAEGPLKVGFLFRGKS